MMCRARVRAAVALLALSLLTTACGPHLKLDVGVREEFGDLTYGDTSKPAPPLRPSGAEPAGFPSFVVPPPRVKPVAEDTTPATVPFVPRPNKCPGAPPDAPLAAALSDTVSGPPVAGDYLYRRSANVLLGTDRRILPNTALRTVENVQEIPLDPGETQARRQFDVAEYDDDGTRTVTTYQVSPASAVPGLAIVAITTQGGPNGASAFYPQPPIRIMTLPARAEDKATEEVGVDPNSGTTMRISHRTVGSTVVVGCKERYAAWRVQIEGSIVAGPGADVVSRDVLLGKSLRIQSILDIAPQYGGIVLHDDVNITGNDDGQAYELHSENEITSVQVL